MPLSPFVRHPWMFLSGVHSLLNQRKKQKHGFPIKDFGNDGGGGIPEWFYHPSFVTPAIFKPGSRSIKGRPLYNPPKREQPKLKEKTENAKDYWGRKSIFLVKSLWIPDWRFWEWRMMLDSLNASIIPLSVIPEWFYQESKQWEGTSLYASFPSPSTGEG